MNTCFRGKGCLAVSPVRRGLHNPLTTALLSRPAWACVELVWLTCVWGSDVLSSWPSIPSPACQPPSDVSTTALPLPAGRPSEARVWRPASCLRGLPKHEALTPRKIAVWHVPRGTGSRPPEQGLLPESPLVSVCLSPLCPVVVVVVGGGSSQLSRLAPPSHTVGLSPLSDLRCVGVPGRRGLIMTWAGRTLLRPRKASDYGQSGHMSPHPWLLSLSLCTSSPKQRVVERLLCVRQSARHQGDRTQNRHDLSPGRWTNWQTSVSVMSAVREEGQGSQGTQKGGKLPNVAWGQRRLPGRRSI